MHRSPATLPTGYEGFGRRHQLRRWWAEGVVEDGGCGEEGEVMTPAVVAAEGVGEDGRWGEEAEAMTPAAAAGSQGLEDRCLMLSRFLAVKTQSEGMAVVAVQTPEEEEEHPAPVRRRNGGGGEKSRGGPVGVQEVVDGRDIPGPHTAPVRWPLRQGRPSRRWRSSPEGAGVQSQWQFTFLLARILS